MTYTPFRPDDLKGVELSSFSILETENGADVAKLLKVSQLVWTVRRRGVVLSVVGCHAATALSGEAFVWAVTTKAMERLGAPAMLYHMRLIGHLQEKFNHLQGVVSPDCRRWIELLGFTLGPLLEDKGRPYHVFDWSR